MTLLITKGTFDKFQNVLGLNRRACWATPQAAQRVNQIDKCIASTGDIVHHVMETFWKFRAQYKNLGHLEFRERFYSRVCKVRIVFYVNPTHDLPSAVGGYIVLDGELVGFHMGIRGSGLWLLDHAIADGAVRLSCFDIPHLLKLYSNRGFVEVRREPNRVEGEPDVVWMELKK